ncbi:MAG: AbrB/MazE/SpoVT family DNA-binding domain-containing protein [Methanobacteriota archaeon]
MAIARRVKVTRHGQTTIPKEAREKFGIGVGSVLEVRTTEDSIVYRPVPQLEDLAGSLSKYASVRKVKQSLDRTREDED